MRYNKIITLLTCFYSSFNLNAQLSTNELPVSYGMKLTNASKGEAQTIIMPKVDMAKIEAEEKEDLGCDKPFRFGYRHKVSYDLTNSGTWYDLPNGGKLWLLNVVCPDALSVNFCYDKFWIPEGGKFFVYSKDKKQHIGAFTCRNNKGNRENIEGFATELIFGNEVTLEYYQPKQVTTDAIISIDYIVHGYKSPFYDERSSVDDLSCMVNVNCEEGQEWQIEKKAVALIIYQGKASTGSLLNSTDLSEKPFFLTANHNISDYGDAASNTSLTDIIFYWNYETIGCNDNILASNYTTQGATIIANNSFTDFALLRLTEDPKYLSNYTPYYLGWDRTGQSGMPGVCIHHPLGAVKKISTVGRQPTSSYYIHNSIDANSHWKVLWKRTTNGYGTAHHGSSGSPLLTAAHKVIGHLHGGRNEGCLFLETYCKFGKFDVSWIGNGNDSIQRRLDCWLDSLNTGAQTMEGLLIIPVTSTMNTDQQLYSNIRITSTGQLTVLSDVELMGNSRVIVEAGGELIVDGGTLSNVELELKAGSSLQIINGGIIETRSGFEAPLGATVNIIYGQIL